MGGVAETAFEMTSIANHRDTESTEKYNSNSLCALCVSVVNNAITYPPW